MNHDPVDMDKAMESVERGTVRKDGLVPDLKPLQDTQEYPWERLPGEPNLWFDRFFKYFLKQGARRSVIEAFRRYRAAEGDGQHFGQSGPNWQLEAHRWNWFARAEAYDEHQRMLDHIKWEERRATLREKEWDVSNELLEIAQGHLKTVRGSQAQATVAKSDSGRVQVPRVIVKNQDAARFAELGSKLGRLAAGMDTEQIGVDVRVRIEEIRKQRWEDTLPQLQEVVDGEFELVEDETVNEPPEVSQSDETVE